MRLIDVLETERDPLAERRSFALRAHLDFTVVDAAQVPLFAVEYDGPQHAVAIQRERDAKKNSLCRDHELPLLRITSRHLTAYRGMDLLTWIVNVWFTQRAFNAAQQAGAIPWEEDFDPLTAMTYVDGKLSRPFWFAGTVHEAVRTLHRQNRIFDPIPSMAVARNMNGAYEGIAWLRISKDAAIYATTRLRDQDFPVNFADAVEQIVEVELYEKLKQVFRGALRPLPANVVNARVVQFQREHQLQRASFVGQSPADFGM